MTSIPSVSRAHADVNDPLVVLHVCAGNMFGGIERVLLTLAQQQHAHGMRSCFALCFEGRLAQQLRARGVPVDVLGDARVRYPWSVIRARRNLSSLAGRERFDVAVFHGCWPLALFAPVASEHGLPVVYWSHDAPKGNHWIERWARRRSPDLVIANSRATARAVAEFFPSAARDIVHCPVPASSAASAPDVRRRVRAEMGVTDDERVILMASRLEPLKGHLVLVEALDTLRANPRWVAWIAGSASSAAEHAYAERIVAQARKAQIESRIRLLGHRDDVPDLLAAADIYCQPNTGPETFGISFIEALYAKRPVVTSAIGGALEIVDGTCGVLVPPGDATALATALSRLLEDDTIRTRLGEAGPPRARALCDVATQLEHLHGLLDGSRRAAHSRGRFASSRIDA
jgi:glycosyltransferase involved in cell wall biosynthesis